MGNLTNFMKLICLPEVKHFQPNKLFFYPNSSRVVLISGGESVVGLTQSLIFELISQNTQSVEAVSTAHILRAS